MTLLNQLVYVTGKDTSLSALIEGGMLTYAEAAFLLERLHAGESLMICGLPGIGKSTLLRALVAELGRDVAVVPAPTQGGYGYDEVLQFMHEALASKAEVIVLETVMGGDYGSVIHEAITDRQFISTGGDLLIRGVTESLQNAPTIFIGDLQLTDDGMTRIEWFQNF